MAAILKISKTIVVQATVKHTATLFFFHGSGSSADECKEALDILNGGELRFPHIKIIYPTAPAQPYTPLGGMMSNVWFDRKDISINAPEEEKSIDSMCQIISELIEKEVNEGIPYNRIVIGGYSMGGALSFHMAYKYKPSVAGCGTISSFLNKNSLVYKHLKSNPEMHKPQLLQIHGTADDLVPYEWGEETHKTLQQFNIDAKLVPIENVGHELSTTAVNVYKEWILNVLPEI